MKFTRFVTIAILFFMGFLNVFSQRKPPVSGGRTYKHTKRPPIKSTELKSVRTSFFIIPIAYNNAFQGHYSLEAKLTDDGKCMLSCNNEKALVSADILTSIQDIIKTNNLEKNNGLYNVTAGLPPECQPMNFTAVYKSDEQLSFTENNNPNCKWTFELFKLFRKKLIASGNTKYVIPLEQRCIDRLTLEYSEGDGIVHMYGNIIMGDDTVNLYREVFEAGTNKVISDDKVPVPENHYKGINELTEELELPLIANYKYSMDPPDATKHRFCYIYANDAESHNLFSSLYLDDEMTDEVIHILHRLAEYMDKPFDKKK